MNIENDGHIELKNPAPQRRRPKLAALGLSDQAASRIHALIETADRPLLGIRVGVKNGGCAGMSYVLDYVEQSAPLDEVVEDKGVKIFIDPKAFLFLLGSTIDVRQDKFSSGFVFHNPNETAACGCGESVAITPAKLD